MHTLNVLVPRTWNELIAKEENPEWTVRLIDWTEKHEDDIEAIKKDDLHTVLSRVERFKIPDSELPRYMRQLARGLRDETPWALEVITLWCKTKQWYLKNEQPLGTS